MLLFLRHQVKFTRVLFIPENSCFSVEFNSSLWNFQFNFSTKEKRKSLYITVVTIATKTLCKTTEKITEEKMCKCTCTVLLFGIFIFKKNSNECFYFFLLPDGIYFLLPMIEWEINTRDLFLREIFYLLNLLQLKHTKTMTPFFTKTQRFCNIETQGDWLLALLLRLAGLLQGFSRILTTWHP